MPQRPYIWLLTKARDALIENPLSNEMEKDAARALYYRVKVTMNPRLKVTAGRANYKQCSIEYSKCIFEGISEEEKYNTVAHEFAHLVTDTVYVHILGLIVASGSECIC